MRKLSAHREEGGGGFIAVTKHLGKPRI